ncbi:MAG: hypothetical protein ACOYN0_01280 [Phycisphaerales bacterium]
MKMCVALFAVAAAAGSALAIDVSAAPIGEEPGYAERGVPIFSAMPGPFAAFPAATGSIGFDDYDSILPGGYDVLTDFKFVGGVTTIGGRLDFNFYHPDGTLISNFFVTLPQAGNFIWTINNINIIIPTDGIVEAVAAADTTGRWYLSTTAPTLGTQNAAFGGAGGGNSHRFELQVPAPGAAALMGLAGLVAGRRRR